MFKKVSKKFFVLTFILIIIVLVVILFYTKEKITLEDLAPGRTLAWNDEFDKLDSKVWDYETGAIRNQELQWYQNDEENVFCKNGILHLKAIKNNPKEGYEWSSGSIISRNGFAFGDGLIEAKVKYDPQKGCWPAFWGKGFNYWRDYESATNLGVNWPECGELDMAEFTYKGKYQGGGFWLKDDISQQGFGTTNISDYEFDDQWHIIGMERTNKSIQFYYDRKLIGTLPKEKFQDELYTPYNIILNLAIGGGAQGNPEESLEETEFLVDWVRYYLPKSEKKLYKASELKLDCGSNFELGVGQRRILNPIFDVDYPSNYCVKWKSSDESVATCYAGTVKAISNGKTVITATSPEGLEASAVLTVKNKVANITQKIELYTDSSVIDYNTTSIIRVVAKPEYRSNKDVIWKSSDESIATVKDGAVTAINPKGGKVKITCTSADGGASDSMSFECKPQVKDNIAVEGLIAKYTKKGWGSTGWRSDLKNKPNFQVTGNASTGFIYLNGIGYQQKYISDTSNYCESGNHMVGTDLIDIDGPFTIAVRYLYPTNSENSGGNAFEIINENGTAAGSIQLQTTHLYVKNSKGENIIDKEFKIDGDITHDRVITAIFVKDSNRVIKLYINGKMVLKSDEFAKLKKMNLKGMNIGISNKSISNAVYQAFIAYDRSFDEDEISILTESINIMYN